MNSKESRGKRGDGKRTKKVCAEFMYNVYVMYQYSAHWLLFHLWVIMQLSNVDIYLILCYLFFKGPADMHRIDSFDKARLSTQKIMQLGHLFLEIYKCSIFKGTTSKGLNHIKYIKTISLCIQESHWPFLTWETSLNKKAHIIISKRWLGDNRHYLFFF